ncbi:MAG: hypothetical protein IGS03_06190 [Candidatus Sericytochromatia bacterium]|nr:hypothetical protein [Candidatus Sericytochromatia bacterium]
MNVKMYTVAREAATKARNVASAIQQTQRQVNDDNKDIKDKVDKNSQIRSKRKAELEVGAAQTAKNLAQKQAKVAQLQAIVAGVQALASIGAALTEKALAKEESPEEQEDRLEAEADKKEEKADKKEARKDARAVEKGQMTPEQAQARQAARNDRAAARGERADARDARAVQREANATEAKADKKEAKADAKEAKSDAKAVENGEMTPEEAGARQAARDTRAVERTERAIARGENPANPNTSTAPATNNLNPTDGTVTNTNNQSSGTTDVTNQRGTPTGGGNGPTAVTNAENNTTTGNNNPNTQGTNENASRAIGNGIGGRVADVDEEKRANVTAGAEKVGATVEQGIEKIQRAVGTVMNRIGLNPNQEGGKGPIGFGSVFGEKGDQADKVVGDVMGIIKDIIEQLKKAAGIQVDGGVFSEITDNASKLGELLTTGSYQDGDQRKELNGAGKLVAAVVQPVAAVAKATLQTAGVVAGVAATAAFGGIPGVIAAGGIIAGLSTGGSRNDETAQGLSGESDSALQGQVSDIIASGSLTEADEGALKENIAQSLRQADPSISLADIETRQNEIIGATRNAIAGQVIQSQGGNSLAGLNLENGSINVNGQEIQLDEQMVKDLSSGDPAARQAALQTLQNVVSASNNGSLNIAAGQSATLSSNGNLSLSQGDNTTNTNVTALAVSGPGASIDPNAANTNEARATAGVAALIAPALANGDSVANVTANNQGGLTVSTANGEEINLSNKDLQQLQALNGPLAGLGIEASITGGELTFQTADGQALSAGQMDQLVNIANTMDISGASIGFSGNELQISGLNGTEQTRSVDSLNSSLNQAQRALGNGSLQGVTLAQLETLSTLSSLSGASDQLSLQGAKIGADGSIELASGFNVTQNGNGGLTIAANSTEALRALSGDNNATAGTLEISAEAIQALSSSNTNNLDAARLNNAVQAGLTLAQAGTNTNLNFENANNSNLRVQLTNDNPDAFNVEALSGQRIGRDELLARVNNIEVEGLGRVGDLRNLTRAQAEQVQAAINNDLAGLGLDPGKIASIQRSRDSEGNLTSGFEVAINGNELVKANEEAEQNYLQGIKNIAKGNASPEDLARLGVMSTQQIAVAQMAAQGLNLNNAQLDNEGALFLNNGASIGASALTAFANSNSGEFRADTVQRVTDDLNSNAPGSLGVLVDQINGQLMAGNVSDAEALLSQGIERLTQEFGFTEAQAKRALSFNYTLNSENESVPTSANVNLRSASATASNQQLQTNTAFQAFVGTVASQNAANGVRLNFDSAGNTDALNTNGFSITAGNAVIGNGDTLRSMAEGGERGRSAGQEMLRLGRMGTNNSFVPPVSNSSGTSTNNTGNMQRPSADQIAADILGTDLSTQTAQPTSNSPIGVGLFAGFWQEAARTSAQSFRDAGGVFNNMLGRNAAKNTPKQLQRAASDDIGRVADNAVAAVNQLTSGRQTSGLTETQFNTLKDELTTELEALGFSQDEIDKILSGGERRDANNQGTGIFDLNIRDRQIRKAVERDVSVSQTQDQNGNVSFDVSLGRFAQFNDGEASLGNAQISSQGEITGTLGDALSPARSNAAGDAIGSMLRTQFGVSNMDGRFRQGIGSVQLASDGSLAQMTLNGQAVSTQEFARALLESRQRGPVSDAQVQQLVSQLNETAKQATSGTTQQIVQGGQRGGLSGPAQATLQNLRATMGAAGADLSKMRVQFDSKGGANISFDGSNETFRIDKNGNLTQTNIDNNGNTTVVNNLADDREANRQPNATVSNPTLEAFFAAAGADPNKVAENIEKFNKNQDQIENLRNSIDGSMSERGNSYENMRGGVYAERVLAGIFTLGISEAARSQTGRRILAGIGTAGLSELDRATGASDWVRRKSSPRTQNMNVNFDANGNVIGANVRLNNNNSFDLNVNPSTGSYAISNLRGANGAPADDKTRRGAERFLSNLRTNGLEGEGTAERVLNNLSGNNVTVSDIALTGITNRRTQELNSSDTNPMNDKFTQQGRLAFTLNNAGNEVDFNLQIGFDDQGRTYVNLDDLMDLDRLIDIDQQIKNGADRNQFSAQDRVLLQKLDTMTQQRDALVQMMRDKSGDQNLSETAALLQFQRAFGGQGAGFGINAIRDDQGNIMAQDLLTEGQQRNRDIYAADLIASEGIAGRAGAGFAGTQLKALLGDQESLAALGGDKNTQQRRKDFAAIVNETGFNFNNVNADQKAQLQRLLDQSLAANGMMRGSVKLEDLFGTDGKALTAQELSDKLGSISVTTGFDGRVAAVSGEVSFNGEKANFNITTDGRGNTTTNVDASGISNTNARLGLNRAVHSQQTPVGTPGEHRRDSFMEGLSNTTKTLGIALEAALPGIQALKKALEELQEANIQLAAAKEQLGAAMAYAREIGVTFGSLTNFGDDSGVSTETSGTNQPVVEIPGLQVPGPQQASPEEETEAGSEGPLESQQDAQSNLLDQISGDANFANVAVLIGMNPGLLIQQAQQLEMVEELAEVLVQLQSPFGNPVQEMQRFVEQLKARLDESQLPLDAPFVGG